MANAGRKHNHQQNNRQVALLLLR